MGLHFMQLRFFFSVRAHATVLLLGDISKPLCEMFEGIGRKCALEERLTQCACRLKLMGIASQPKINMNRCHDLDL
jgi:hypothetical protein